MQPGYGSFRIENVELTGGEGRLSMDVTGDGDGVTINILIDGTVRKTVIVEAEDDTAKLKVRKHGDRELEINQDLLPDWR